MSVSADLNLYRYGADNPERFVDQYGLEALPMPTPTPTPGPGFPKLVPPACPAPKPVIPPWLAALGGYGTAIGGSFFGPFVPDAGGPGDTLPDSPPDPKKCDKCQEKKCAPCIPPVGTVGYQIHTGHKHFPYGDPQLKLWRVNQDPNTCNCYWNAYGYRNPPPLPDWVPYNGHVFGGGFQ
jgi:hypothetical protein